jgi:hypothetical protein
MGGPKHSLPGSRILMYLSRRSEDWSSLTPDEEDWLPPSSKIDTAVTGVARAGPELWLAWSGARKISGRDQNAFPHPHIGIAVISLQGR